MGTLTVTSMDMTIMKESMLINGHARHKLLCLVERDSPVSVLLRISARSVDPLMGGFFELRLARI